MKSHSKKVIPWRPDIQKEFDRHLKIGMERGIKIGKQSNCEIVKDFIKTYYKIQDNPKSVKFLIMSLEEKMDSVYLEREESYAPF
jgi:hypothetical protein